ncbi:MAG: alanine:cation symporter family protein, partial [Flavobacteriales bacterium]|nr:alanine:cation symporter family protein [Flavobacteriales bacterium]
MKKLAAILLCIPQFLRAESTASETINSLFEPIVDVMAKVIFWEPFMGIPIVVIWLVVGAVFFTIRMNFINIRGFKHAIQLVKGDFDNPDDQGEVSHFQALTTALSATVGLGNIAGVAVAVAIGGPGATFWMIVAG